MKISFKQIDGDWRMHVDGKKVLLAPFPGSQDAFVRSPDYEVLYSGPRAVGKTLALLMAYWANVGAALAAIGKASFSGRPFLS